MQTILNTITNTNAGFSVMVGPGNIYAGGAVAFIPQQDCNLVSVTLRLTGYTVQMSPHFALQILLSDSQGQPASGGFPNFNGSTPNDGSTAEFTFELPSKVALKGGQTYWILAYGGTTPNAPVSQIVQALWTGGAAPSGTAQFKGSLVFQRGAFSPSSIIPAFRINIE